MDWQEFGWFALWGGIAALVGSMTKTRHLRLPSVWIEVEREGRSVRYVDPGFLTAPLLGALLAAVLDGRPWTAVCWGLSAGWAGPAVIDAMVDGVLTVLTNTKGECSKAERK